MDNERHPDHLQAPTTANDRSSLLAECCRGEAHFHTAAGEVNTVEYLLIPTEDWEGRPEARDSAWFARRLARLTLALRHRA